MFRSQPSIEFLDYQRGIWRLGQILTLILLLPQAAFADSGLPMIVYIWPAAWILLLPIVAIEAFVAKRVVGLRTGGAFKLSFVANLVSSIIGVPVTYLLMAVMTFSAALATGEASPIILRTLIEAARNSIWSGSGGYSGAEKLNLPMDFYLLLILLFLFAPYYFSSVWIEAMVAQRFTKDKTISYRWSWIANSLSYGLLILVCLVGHWFSR